MGLRFKKSFKLGKGMRFNFGKKSAGLSFGMKGARFSISTKGRISSSFGIPGTGISYSKSATLFPKAKKKKMQHKPTVSTRPQSVGLIQAPQTYTFFKASTACAWCGKKKGLFEVFTKHGFCDKCNKEVRDKLKAGLAMISKTLELCQLYSHVEIEISKEDIVGHINEALNIIFDLESIRPRVPFFVSSTREQKQALDIYKFNFLTGSNKVVTYLPENVKENINPPQIVLTSVSEEYIPLTVYVGPPYPKTINEAELAAPQWQKQAKDCMNLICSTKVPDVFFNRYDFLIDCLECLRRLDCFVDFTGEHPSSLLLNIMQKHSVLVSGFIERYYDSVLKKILSLKTQFARKDHAHLFLLDLNNYKHKMESDNIIDYEQKADFLREAAISDAH